MDKLTTMLGCNVGALVNTLSLLLCSSTTNTGKTFHSAVHFPTETVITQLSHEIQLGSISNPQALDQLTQVVKLLESAVQSDSLLRPTLQDGLSVPDINQLMLSKDELVNNFDKNAKKQRKVVEMVLSNQEQESVLERPPLASQVEETLRKKRGVPADNVLNDLQSPECAFTKLSKTLCSPTDVTKAINNLVTTFATSISKLEQARHTLLNDIVQSQGCSSPGVTGNMLAWASLGSSEQALVNILASVLEASKTAQEQQGKENAKVNGDKPLKNVDMTKLLSEFPGLFESSLGQLGSTAADDKRVSKPTSNKKQRTFFDGFFGK